MRDVEAPEDEASNEHPCEDVHEAAWIEELAGAKETCATPTWVSSISVKLVERPDLVHSVSPI